MKHGKYLVFSILYSNLFLNEACKRGWSSILKGSQQGTVAVRENLKEKIYCALSCPDHEERGEQNVDCVHGQDEDCDIYRVLFLTVPLHFQYQKKKLAQPTRIIFHLFNYELEASLVDEAAEDLDLWDWNDL